MYLGNASIIFSTSSLLKIHHFFIFYLVDYHYLLVDAFFLVDADLGGAAVNQEGLVSLLVVMIGYKGIFYVNGIPKLIDHPAALRTDQQIPMVVTVRYGVEHVPLGVNVHGTPHVFYTHLLSLSFLFFAALIQ